ncbi:hypothetical protein BH24ACT26_BH24ACT26_05070 [soil metagenome]
MKLKIVLVLFGALVVVGALSAYVGLSAGRELLAARAALSDAPQDLHNDELEGARDHLEAAVDRLGSLPARILGAVPVARQNVNAVRAAAREAIPVLESGLALERSIDAIEDQGLMEGGAVKLDLVRSLEGPLADETRALRDLEASLEANRTGWLLPPLWDEIDEQLERTRSLRRAAERAAGAVDVAPAMLGARGPRTYLVIMLNNAELRGAGGILSGVGTLSAHRGRLELGDFSYYKALADPPPYRTVPAPEDYESHFRQYDAATTRWVSASSSPDVPDVALVAARLYRLTRGVSTEGARIVDPRVLGALMPESARVPVPGTDTVLNRHELARYFYSRAYEEVDEQAARRDALVGVGKLAFESVLEQGIRGRATLTSAADAVAGGHLRVVSFDRGEQAALERLGASGELGAPEADGSLVTVQNFGGNKLDFWARRHVGHSCDLAEGGSATCSTEVAITNRVPPGLPRFVTQAPPYGLFQSYVEVYTPATARLTRVDVDGQPARFATQPEDGYTAVGVYVEVARGDRAEIEVRYRLPLGDAGYSLEARPQPLSRDAAFDVAVSVPSGWTASGPGSVTNGVLRYSGELDESLTWVVEPSSRTGIPALWAGAARFWNEPLF